MTDDERLTLGFVFEVLDVMVRHGFRRGDNQHAGQSIELICNMARTYERTMDAPDDAYVVVPSAPPTPPPSPHRPGQDAVLVSADEVTTLLAALGDAAEYKRDRAETCADCAGQSCATCQWRLQAAEAYDQMAGQMIHAAEASAAQQHPADHAAPPSAGPDAAADMEAGQ